MITIPHMDATQNDANMAILILVESTRGDRKKELGLADILCTMWRAPREKRVRVLEEQLDRAFIVNGEREL